MGRIKTTLIKRSAKKLMDNYRNDFSADFESNKQSVVKNADIPSKKLRNVLAGYISRLVKKEEANAL